MNSLAASLATSARPYCEQLGLPLLPRYIPTIIQSLGLWVGLQLLSSKVSPKLFPKTWPTLKKSTRTSWSIHFVALVHATVITPLTARIWWKVYQQGGMAGDHIFAKDRLYGIDHETSTVYAISLGYFMWDAVVSALVSLPNLNEQDFG